jgi:hypothetical protein
MPLHVDRTSIHANLAPREHVLEHHAAGRRHGSSAAQAQAEVAPSDATLRLAQVATPGPSDVANVEQAEALVRKLAAGGGNGLAAAHGALDPARVASLLQD